MSPTVRATMPQGTVTGLREAACCRFSAIPYAQAPVAELRFKPPLPATWKGELDATRPGPVAPQLPSRLRGAMGDFAAPQSEDCLHLTVWTPAPDRARRPVLVWLHGGAWQSGGGAVDWYDGARLAVRGDIVVVAPNYRLAGLGWLAPEGGTANLGILDQELALDWVARHIEAFGGDPDRVTVMGQSAGGMSIANLLMRGQPKFQRAVLQSASLGRGMRSAAQAAEIARIFLRAAGAHNVEEARRLPVAALLEAQKAPDVLAWLAAENAHRALFGPVADGEVLPADEQAALKRASGRVDSVAGYTADEMNAFPTPSAPGLGDEVFGAPARRWAADAAAQGRRAWSFRFDHAPNERFGACHCIELPFVFGTVEAFKDAPMLQGLRPEEAVRLVTEMQQAWIGFIRDGDPGWPEWPQQKVFA
ncbi:carboxylesterase/lipase family protein [Ramlibacter rhizophilus]|uniref:Carboxylic ester hydrolase n=1 Tax=Ramlibacter rhizophilus TaxID=1781167 RepID=A0A4Z0BZM1_9BURK|nr:carboxylesterase family protein [Ramlibacter rhizophilus]TFZ03409.1 carboxylesterase/lipase family protein [Ramlibacter rhizophilus]